MTTTICYPKYCRCNEDESIELLFLTAPSRYLSKGLGKYNDVCANCMQMCLAIFGLKRTWCENWVSGFAKLFAISWWCLHLEILQILGWIEEFFNQQYIVKRKFIAEIVGHCSLNFNPIQCQSVTVTDLQWPNLKPLSRHHNLQHIAVDWMSSPCSSLTLTRNTQLLCQNVTFRHKWQCARRRRRAGRRL